MRKTDILNNGSRRKTDEKIGEVRETESRSEGEKGCKLVNHSGDNERERERYEEVRAEEGMKR